MLCFYMLRNIRMPVTSRSWSMSHSGRFSHQTRQEVTLTAMTSALQLPEHSWQSSIFLPFRPPGYGHLCPPRKHDDSINNTKNYSDVKVKVRLGWVPRSTESSCSHPGNCSFRDWQLLCPHLCEESILHSCRAPGSLPPPHPRLPLWASMSHFCSLELPGFLADGGTTTIMAAWLQPDHIRCG